MRELSRELAYAFPFEVIKGKVDIFSIDPALAMRVESEKLKVSTAVKSSESPLKKGVRGIDISQQEITIYNIQGKIVRQLTMSNEQITINVSTLQKGIYFVKVGENVAKFVKK